MALGVGMIGSGYMAHKHAAVLARHPQCRLVSVCSTQRSAGAARDFQREYGFARHTIRWEDLAADPEVDVVYVCSPDATHADCTVKMLEAGKHVFCEKPLATHEEEFLRIESALARSGRLLQVGMNCRYREQYALPRRLVASGELGRLHFLRGTYVYNSVERARKREKEWWFAPPHDTFFFLHGGGIHCLDLLRWIGGHVTSVYARSTGFELGSDFRADTFSISLEFHNGAIGELLVSASAFQPRDFSLQAWLSGGSVVATQRFESGGESEVRVFRRQGDSPNEEPEDLPVEQPSLDLSLQYDELVGAVLHGQPLMNSFEEARENFRVLHAIERSIQEGRPVGLELTGPSSRRL